MRESSCSLVGEVSAFLPMYVFNLFYHIYAHLNTLLWNTMKLKPYEISGTTEIEESYTCGKLITGILFPF